MKTVLGFLLLVSFGSFAVKALTCYSCTSSLSNTQCNQNPINCTAGLDTCMTSVINVLGIHSTSKTCSTNAVCSAAAATNINLVVGGNQVTCCSTSLCNVNSSTVERLNLLLLVFPSALLALFTLGKA
ncbi:prostate stem cell antigen-like isoform X1 [Amia ocellicauda]|uniref:prostate stem cell antigen-like isoform X1 n=1 Tax=Amia ocellicauda TaxID=2972642 RepID=UPI003463968E